MARQSAAPAKQLSRRIYVAIKRDMMTTISRVIWEHELPLLQALHGEGEVTALDPTTLDDGYSNKASRDLLPHNKVQDGIARPSESLGLNFIFIGDPEAEYNRLLSAYGVTSEEDGNIPAVRFVYGRFQDNRFAPMLGRPTLEDLPRAQLIEIILDNGYLPQVPHDAPREERMAVAEQEKQLRAMPAPDLLKLAAEQTADLN
jgi:hypothetical protein